MNKINNFFLQNRPKFIKGIVSKNDFILNSRLKEVAFIGKSNVGKSSLINAITSSNIAKTSKTPGRTREINIFSLEEKAIFVDMPGYGFAFADEEKKYKWRELILEYFSCKNKLSRLFILVDSRRGIADHDIDLFEMLEEGDFDFEYQIILTKIDSINKEEYARLLDNIKQQIKNYQKIVKEILFSSITKKYGLEEIRKTIFTLINEKK